MLVHWKRTCKRLTHWFLRVVVNGHISQDGISTWPKKLNGAQRSKGERAFLNSGTDLKTHFLNMIEVQSQYIHL